MRVLLLHPPLARPSLSEIALRQEPVAHLALGPVLREHGHDVRVVDLRVTPDLARELGAFHPDAAVVGVGPLTRGSVDAALGELCRRHRDVDVLLFPEAEYGNTHVAERPEDFFHPLADALVVKSFLNDLVQLVPEVVDTWAAGRPLDDVSGLWLPGDDGEWHPTAERPDVLGDYGVPDRTLLGRARGRYQFGGISDTAFVFTSFGCPFRCRFCPMSKWSGGEYARTPDHVVRELALADEQNVFLADFEPLQLPDHMRGLAEALRTEGIRKRFNFMTRADSVEPNADLLEAWRAVGLRWVYLGLDGHSAVRLREVRKGNELEDQARALQLLEELGIAAVVGFVVRSDFTLEDFRELRRYVKELDPPTVGFTIETPLVGTTLFDETADRLTTRDWSLYDLQHAVLPTSLPLDRFYREMVKLHLFGMGRSARSVVAERLLPFADQARAAGVYARRLPDLWFGARHHRNPPGPPRRRVLQPA